jgi:uncharacterized membrane protein
MQEFYKSGKIFFAFAIIAFGIIQMNVGEFMTGFLPMPENLPVRHFFLYLISGLFVISGIAMCIKNTARRAAFFTGVLLLILFIYPHLFSLLTDLHNGGIWTSSAEDLALCGGAFIIAGDYAFASAADKDKIRPSGIFLAGKVLFAASLLVFAIQHFMYADFIATLIPSWIPGKLFFAYFVGVAFSAAAISILTNIQTRLACILLGFMYLFWMIFLHLPRVAADTHIEAEKTSMFIALAFSGIFFTLASLYERKPAIENH